MEQAPSTLVAGVRRTRRAVLLGALAASLLAGRTRCAAAAPAGQGEGAAEPPGTPDVPPFPLTAATVPAAAETPAGPPSVQAAEGGQGQARLAVIGDYGRPTWRALDVATLVKGWQPDCIVTVGDNNYPDGAATTIDTNVGQFYHDCIAGYAGRYGEGAPTNRFFPALGNHDWKTPGAKPYLEFFQPPGNGRYYSVNQGPVALFIVDSDSHEPDGVSSTSLQAHWLQRELAASDARWKLVILHHPPFSSGAKHGSTAKLQWPFAAWGADAVLAGHDHTYERIMRDGIPYVVNGVGSETTGFRQPLPGSAMRYARDVGALLVEASASEMSFQFMDRTGAVIDQHSVAKPWP